jgi:hypothetical protein
MGGIQDHNRFFLPESPRPKHSVRVYSHGAGSTCRRTTLAYAMNPFRQMFQNFEVGPPVSCLGCDKLYLQSKKQIGTARAQGELSMGVSISCSAALFLDNTKKPFSISYPW